MCPFLVAAALYCRYNFIIKQDLDASHRGKGLSRTGRSVGNVVVALADDLDWWWQIFVTPFRSMGVGITNGKSGVAEYVAAAVEMEHRY